MAMQRFEVPLNASTIVSQPTFTIRSAVIENLTSSSCILVDSAGNTYRNYAGQITKLSIQPSVNVQAALEYPSDTGQCIITLSDIYIAESAVPGYAGQPSQPPEIAFYDRLAHPQTFVASRFINTLGGFTGSTVYTPFVPGYAYYIHASHLHFYVYDAISIPAGNFVAQCSLTCRIQKDSEAIALIGGSNGSHAIPPSMYRDKAYAEISYPLGLWLSNPADYSILFGWNQGIGFQIEMFASVTCHMTRYVL